MAIMTQQEVVTIVCSTQLYVIFILVMVKNGGIMIIYNIDLKRYCIPVDNINSMKATLMNSSGGVKLGQYVGDLGTCWWLFLVMLGISTAIAFIYLMLLRCLAKPLLYVSFVLILVILVAGGAYVFAS